MLNGFGFALRGPARGGVGSGSACAPHVHSADAASVAAASAVFSPVAFIVGPPNLAAATQSSFARLSGGRSANSMWQAAPVTLFELALGRICPAVVAMQHRLPARWAHRCPIGRMGPLPLPVTGSSASTRAGQGEMQTGVAQERFAGDVARFRTGEEQHRLCDLGAVGG